MISEYLRARIILKRTASREIQELHELTVGTLHYTYTQIVSRATSIRQIFRVGIICIFCDRKSELLFANAFIRCVDGIIDRSSQFLSCQVLSIFFPSLQNDHQRGRSSSQWQFAEDFPWGGFIPALTWTLDTFGDMFVDWPLPHSKCTPRCLHSRDPLWALAMIFCLCKYGRLENTQEEVQHFVPNNFVAYKL